VRLFGLRTGRRPLNEKRLSRGEAGPSICAPVGDGRLRPLAVDSSIFGAGFAVTPSLQGVHGLPLCDCQLFQHVECPLQTIAKPEWSNTDLCQVADVT
jgi:hypothetical protein